MAETQEVTLLECLVEFEVMKISAFCEIKPCIPLKVMCRFEGTFRLHFQDERFCLV
jgi:hypothetical protein